jgi:hypothetical protein
MDPRRSSGQAHGEGKQERGRDEHQGSEEDGRPAFGFHDGAGRRPRAYVDHVGGDHDGGQPQGAGGERSQPFERK